MIVATEKRKETGVGLLEDIEYSFEAGPHMMKILSGMYSNPDEAMVREYLTNMYDAHIALFKETGSLGPKPILTLPSALTPMLIFADKGIGMSCDMIRTVYTRYGKSTKSDSNDQVGGFGLGAKVAFAYNGGVDWTVESRKDGEKNTFVARIGPNGMPVLSHINTEKCREHSGTTVSIPVRREDVYRIQNAARELLRYFPIPIEVKNLDGQVPARNVAMEWSNWSISKGDYTNNGMIVIVGNVPYPVSSSELSNIIRLSGITHSYFWTNNEFVVNVPVGSVEIVPSRDNLLYSDTTRNKLAECLRVIAKELKLAATKMVANAATEYEALKMVLDFTNLQYVDDVLTEVDYKGKTLRRGAGLVRPVTDFPNTTFSAYGISDGKSSEIVEIDTTKNVSLTPTPFTRLLIDDVVLGQVRVAKSLAHQMLVSKTGSGRARRWGGHTVGHVLIAKTTLTPQELSDKFGGFPVDRIEKVSDHKKVRAPAGLGINVENIYKFSGRSWSARVNVPKDGSVNYYLPLTKGESRYTFHDDSNWVIQMLNDAVSIGFLDASYRIFGIRADEVANYDAKLWINLENAIGEKLAERIVKDGEKMAIEKEWGSVFTAFSNRSVLCAVLEKDSPMFKTFTETYNTIETAINEMSELKNAVRRYGNAKEVTAALAKLPKPTIVSPDYQWKQITDKYPMIAVLIDSVAGTYYSGRGADIMSKYRANIKGYIAERDSRTP